MPPRRMPLLRSICRAVLGAASISAMARAQVANVHDSQVLTCVALNGTDAPTRGGDIASIRYGDGRVYFAGTRDPFLVALDVASQNWATGLPVVSYTPVPAGTRIYEMILSPDGTGMLIGGLFTSVQLGSSQVAANNVFRFDPSSNSISALGSGVTNGCNSLVSVIADVSGWQSNTVMISSYSTAPPFACGGVTGTVFPYNVLTNTFGSPMDNNRPITTPYAFSYHSAVGLVMGGNLNTQSQTNPGALLSQWDPNYVVNGITGAWRVNAIFAAASTQTWGAIKGFATRPNDAWLYFCGDFSLVDVNGVVFTMIGRFNGVSLQALPTPSTGTNDGVLKIMFAPASGQLFYIGDDFVPPQYNLGSFPIGASSATNVSALGFPSGGVYTLAWMGSTTYDDFYVSGSFTSANGVAVSNYALCTWSGGAASASAGAAVVIGIFVAFGVVLAAIFLGSAFCNKPSAEFNGYSKLK
jgi:hypothetical protein